jgi:hypothetical protein
MLRFADLYTVTGALGELVASIVTKNNFSSTEGSPKQRKDAFHGVVSYKT